MRHPDLIGAVVIFVIGLIAIAAALTTPDPGFGVVGPGVFAGYLGVLVLVTAVWLGWTALSAPRATMSQPIDTGAVVRSLIATTVYFAAFVPVGFIPTSIAYVIAEANILGSRRPVRDAVASVLLVLALYALFVRGLGVQLPPGILPL